VAEDLSPPELARLVDYAERPRQDDWSLRSALVRYAQPHPRRVAAVLELVRRMEFGLHPHLKLLAKEGPAVWAGLQSGEGADPYVVGLLGAMARFDRMGDVLAAWAADRTGPPPDAEIDAAIVEVLQQLDALGVPVEDRTRPPRGARSRG
jgi:hypothetical protein